MRSWARLLLSVVQVLAALAAAAGGTPVCARRLSGATCTVSHYTADPRENDGWTTARDGSTLDHERNMVAVPAGAYESNKHREVTIEGTTYTVRDSCTSCSRLGIDFDILVEDSATAERLGVRRVPCSWKP